jgi:O-antigen/teichoic acid export membrane protein
MYVAALRLAFPWLGPQYRGGFGVTAVLIVGVVFLVAQNLLAVAFLACDRPDLYGKLALLMAAINVLANCVAVPLWGAYGAAMVFGLTQLTGVAIGAMLMRALLAGIAFEPKRELELS